MKKRPKRIKNKYRSLGNIERRKSLLNYIADGKVRCICGKHKYNQSGAREALKNNPELKRVYYCKKGDTYHVTRMALNEQTRTVTKNSDITLGMPLELGNMSRQGDVKTVIVEYMEKLWIKDSEFKVSSRQVVAHILDVRPGVSKPYIMSEISKLKSSGKIVNLDESVPEQRNARYFALSSVIDEMTDPNFKEAIPMNNNSKIPAQTSASNPFDKVNTQLDQLLSMVSGLAQGYAERVIHSTSEVATVDINETAINELKLWGDGLEIRITRAIKDAVNNVDGSEDYKRGIKDGIRMSVEMGLMLPNPTQSGHGE